MDKDTFFTGQPIFSQLLQYIPRHLVRDLVNKHSSDRYCKKFFSYDHLVTMLFTCFHRCTSIREVITGMQASEHRLRHLGLKNTPRRSTLSEANERRPADFFQDLFHCIYLHHYRYLPDSRKKKKLERLFIIDSTTITLFTDIMRGAGSYGLNGKKKGGAKAHVLMRAQDGLPCFVRITEARMHDKVFLKHVQLPVDSIVVFDKGYNDYKKFAEWTYQKVKWVTRLNNSAVWKLVKKRQLNQSASEAGVLSDWVVELGNPRTKSKNPIQTVRIVKFIDPKKHKVFEFLTNDMQSLPEEIALFYKLRWQIELLFKRLKQNAPLQYFLGDNSNAIQIQIWCCLIADLLTKIVKEIAEKLTSRRWSFANLSGLIRIHLNTYVDIIRFLVNPEKALLHYSTLSPPIQQTLF